MPWTVSAIGGERSPDFCSHTKVFAEQTEAEEYVESIGNGLVLLCHVKQAYAGASYKPKSRLERALMDNGNWPTTWD